MVGNVMFFSKGADKADSSAPLEFYHEETENERHLLEVISTLRDNKSFKSLSNVEKLLTWKEIEAATEEALEKPRDNTPIPFDPKYDDPQQLQEFQEIEDFEDHFEEYGDEKELMEHELRQQRFLEKAGLNDFDDKLLSKGNLREVENHMKRKFESGASVMGNDRQSRPIEEVLNFTSTALSSNDEDEDGRKEDDEPADSPLRDDISESDNDAPCPGKKQRSGVKGVLRCTKIDLDTIHHLDVMALRHYVTDDAEIMKRSSTGLCAKCQRHVARTIKRARNMGLMPHIGNFDIQEYPVDDPFRPETHTSVRVDKAYFKSGVNK